MYAAESMCMAMIDGLYREKKSCIEFTFRLDHTCYDKEGEDIGRNIYWKIRYTITKGSRYIKVEWTPYSYQEDIEKWVELADHDSCWRECWDEPLSYACKELIEKYDAKGNESWFFRCERVKSL
jgi:hypothetical protein